MENKPQREPFVAPTVTPVAVDTAVLTAEQRFAQNVRLRNVTHASFSVKIAHSTRSDFAFSYVFFVVLPVLSVARFLAPAHPRFSLSGCAKRAGFTPAALTRHCSGLLRNH